jgi:hypothetical protein
MVWSFLKERDTTLAALPAPSLTAPTAIAPVAAAASSVIARSRPPFLRARLVHSNVPSIEFGPVQSSDCALRLCAGAHFDKTEPFGPAGKFVDDYLGRIHRAVLGEELLQLFVGGCVR